MKGRDGARGLSDVLARAAARRSATPHRMSAVFYALLALLHGGAIAGAWSVSAPSGEAIVIVEDHLRGEPGIFLERRRPDGNADARFGVRGNIPLLMGPGKLPPTGVALDAASRIYVSGAVGAADEPTRPVVLRFTYIGAADAAWGNEGRSEASPPGVSARAFDMLPLPDERVLVLGSIHPRGERGPPNRLIARGRLNSVVAGTRWPFADSGVSMIGGAELRGEHAALWRLDARGRFDPDVADSGWLTLAGDDLSRGVALARPDDGRILIGVLALRDEKALIEVYALNRAVASMPTLVSRQPLPYGWTESPILIRYATGWHWSDPTRPGKPWIALAPAAPSESLTTWIATRSEPTAAASGDKTPANTTAETSEVSAPASSIDDTALWALVGAAILLVGYGVARLMRGGSGSP